MMFFNKPAFGILVLLSIFHVITPCEAALYTENSDQIFENKSIFNIQPFSGINNKLAIPIQQNDGLNKSDDPAYKLGRSGLDLIQNGEIKLGIQKLKESQQINPNLKVTKIALSIAYLKNKNYNDSLLIAQELQRLHPNSPWGYNLAGVAYGFLNEDKLSMNEFSKILLIAPGDPDATLNLSRYHIRNGNIKEALITYQKALAVHPDHLPILLQYSSTLSQTGQLAESIKLLEGFLSKKPSSFQPALLLSKTYLAKGEINKALETIKPFAQTQPENINILEIIAISKLVNNEIEEAIKVFEELTILSPQSHRPYYLLAVSFEKQNKILEAIESIKKSLQINPEDETSQFFYARVLLKTRKFQEAQKALSNLQEKHPTSAALKELQSKIFLAKKQPKEAIRLLEEALKHGKSSNRIILLSAAQFQYGDESSSRRTLETWLEKYPEDLLVRNTLAQNLLLKDMYDDALLHYKIIVSQRSDLASAQNTYAWLLFKKGKLDKAYKHATVAYNKSPTNPGIQDTLGVIFIAKGKTREGLELLRKAEDQLPNNPGIKIHIAQALIKLNILSDAKKILENILSSKKMFKERKLATELLEQLSNQ